jgi:hypothetical protein
MTRYMAADLLKSTCFDLRRSDLHKRPFGRKRKLETRATMSQSRSSIKSNLRQSKPSNNAVTHFRFLDLSAELRNNVYDKIIEETCFVLRSYNVDGPLDLSSAFARTSKGIRSEFLPLALRTAPIIRTEVRNWDFRHVANFLERIGDGEMEHLLREQRVMVDFWFSGKNADTVNLRHWLHRFDDERRGHGVTFEYVCTDAKSSRQNWGLADFRVCTAGGPMGVMQFEKIAGVFGAWN